MSLDVRAFEENRFWLWACRRVPGRPEQEGLLRVTGNQAQGWSAKSRRSATSSKLSNSTQDVLRHFHLPGTRNARILRSPFSLSTSQGRIRWALRGCVCDWKHRGFKGDRFTDGPGPLVLSQQSQKKTVPTVKWDNLADCFLLLFIYWYDAVASSRIHSRMMWQTPFHGNLTIHL